MVQQGIGRSYGLGSKIRTSARGLSMLATCLLLPMAVACSGEARVEGDDSVQVGDENETEPLLVDSFEPDPSMFFGESDEEQERARAAFSEAFADGAVVEKGVNTTDCFGFTVPPFLGPGSVFDNTLAPGGLTPSSICGFGTIGESRQVLIRNFSTITRPGSGIISVGVRNATVAECVDLTVALAVGEFRVNKTPKILFNSSDIRAQLQQRNGVAVCASYVPMFGGSGIPPTENKDLWIAVQARKNGQLNLPGAQNLNDRVHLIRQSDL